MWRYRLLLLSVFGWASVAGCGGKLEPEALTGEQERELQEQIQQVEEEERAHLSPDSPGPGGR